MSKTFKSALSTDKELRITGGPERVCFAQRAHNGMESLVFIDNTEAPALALAILEAAGYSEDDRKVSNSLYATEFASAMIKLADGIEAQERITAEAEAQAKLEAEALELYNVCITGHSLTSFNGMGGALRDQWLAVAHRARELNKEEK